MSALIDDLEIGPVTDIRAIINYRHAQGASARTVNYTYEPAPGAPCDRSEIDARTVTLHNARRCFALDLDRSGFELLRHDSTLGNRHAFSDAALVRAIDYPEVAHALKVRTGASKVLIFDHILRDDAAGADRVAWQGPALGVRADQAFGSVAERVSRHLPLEEAAWRLQRRFAIIHFWRPIGGRVLQSPLAVCDARTIEPEDLLADDPASADGTGETVALAFSPRHRWYWYPNQAPYEAMVCKIFDSATDAHARLTARTAFEDTATASDGSPLRSIELRALTFW